MAPIGITQDGNTPDGPHTFAGLTLISDNYEGEIQDITILPVLWGQMAEPLTRAGKFALGSESAKLIRIARTARPEALYGASTSALSLEASERAILNSIDFECVDVNIAISFGDIKLPHIR